MSDCRTLTPGIGTSRHVTLVPGKCRVMGSGLPQPRIFVSHSAKEPEAKALLRCLAEALSAAGFDSYIADLKMRRGDD